MLIKHLIISGSANDQCLKAEDLPNFGCPFILQDMIHLFRSLLLFFFCFLIGMTKGWSQMPTSFPSDPNEFVDKLGDFMTASKRPDLLEAFTVFEKNYKTRKISEPRLQAVMRVTNLLASQRLSSFPYYLNYINAVSAAVTDPDTTLFDRWNLLTEQTLASIDRGKTKPISQYLDFSADFMEQRAFKKGEGGSVTWHIRGGSFNFLFQDNQPQLECKDVQLIGSRKTDSIEILNASGVYLPLENTWWGKQGKVTWEGAGLDSTVYALLSTYKIEAVKPLFKSDTVQFFYPLYFPKGPIYGSFEHNVTVGAGNQYPKFESFDKHLKINKIGQGIEYEGGFRLYGNSLFGFGTNEDPAQVTMYNRKRQKVFFGTGDLFIIKREQNLVANGVNGKLYMDNDSLSIRPSASVLTFRKKPFNSPAEKKAPNATPSSLHFTT
ncbi:MAG: hypothetical protein IPL65_12775 [Lewinellaceae bacterium]|nr:hypothetical protein [Lewinellaceae bacterium]